MEKTGTAERIIAVAQNKFDFDKIRKEIADANHLVRCTRCEKLIAKTRNDIVEIQHKKLISIAQKPLVIECPKCGMQVLVK